jgi:hypothetical protein
MVKLRTKIVGIPIMRNNPKVDYDSLILQIFSLPDGKALEIEAPHNITVSTLRFRLSRKAEPNNLSYKYTERGTLIVWKPASSC